VSPLDIVVLASGGGSNLRALAGAIDAGRCSARLRAVISDRDSAGALAFAREQHISGAVVAPAAYVDRHDWDRALADAIGAHAPALIVLAGFMRLIGPAVLARFAGRILNVHPALLPAFPGKDAAAQAIAAGVRLSGCTIHVVDAGIDTGPIVAQAAVPVLPSDDTATLHARIQRAEHRLYPAVIDAIARGSLDLGPPVRWLVPLEHLRESALLVPPA
jgi:phosphoribosylglycinamide formyltransferase-1